MGDIFRTVESDSYHFACDEVKYISTSKEAIKEMGEPIIVYQGQRWIFAYDKENCLAGFLCYHNQYIIYAYVLPKYRGLGAFSIMYSCLPAGIEWEVNASNVSYPIFIKKGFSVIKNYKICHKLKLHIDGNN